MGYLQVRLSPRKIVDITFGVGVMGTVGVLIGLLMGASMVPIAAALGMLLGVVIGLLGGRRFLFSILIFTVLGGAFAWLVAGIETVSFGAGAGAALGGFLGVWISMLLDMRAEHKRAAEESFAGNGEHGK
jgi:hypothetical protein